MIEKWKDLKWEMFEYISNRTMVISRRESVLNEVLNKYKPEIIFNDVPQEMLQEFIGSVIDFAYFTKKGVK